MNHILIPAEFHSMQFEIDRYAKEEAFNDRTFAS